MLLAKVLKTIEKYNLIQKGDTVVVGLSGGPDSVCLLHVLYSLSHRLEFKVHAVHINHGLRGGESDEDQEYVERLCTALNVPLQVTAVDIREIAKQNGSSLEMAGREVRYRQFELYADTVGASKIAVAHNKNDQVETVLMNMIRGTGLDGLKGMERQRGRVIRPLLDIERKEIEKYCDEFKLDPRTDSSNLESIYTRNKIRLELIPHINRLFKTDIVESVSRMAFLLSEDYDYIEYSTINLYNSCIVKKERNSAALDLEKLNICPDSMKKRIFRQAIREVKGDLKGIESVHIDSVMTLYKSGRTGAELHLPSDVRVRRSYGTIGFFMDMGKADHPLFEKEVSIPGNTVVDCIGASIRSSVEKVDGDIKAYVSIPQQSFTQYFDYEMLKKGINIRNRRSGDIFKPYHSNGTKKMKEYLIDQKIPRELRDEIPLIAKGNEIVWMVGYKISDKFKVTENTKSVLRIEYKKHHKQSNQKL